MGIIDTHSDYTLYDVLNGTLTVKDQGRGYQEPNGSIDFYGFHIFPANSSGRFNVQYDGHMGTIDTFDANEYDDVLELVDDLMDHVFEAHHFDYQDDKEDLVAWAGKIAVDAGDDRAQKHPELYVEVKEAKE